jgi:hypothetical protein
MSMSELTQNVDIFTDSVDSIDTTKLEMRHPKRELHWPNLALGAAYPVTNRDGRILRHERTREQDKLIYSGGNGDLI